MQVTYANNNPRTLLTIPIFTLLAKKKKKRKYNDLHYLQYGLRNTDNAVLYISHSFYYRIRGMN